MKKIKVRGARENNLKNIEVKLPRNKLVVVTGVSGSGKSSLVFDTLYAEAQRQFMESLSSFARRYAPKTSRPDVDGIEGLSPVIVIDQRKLGSNPRSTVGTVTEVYTYLRLLYSRCGKPYIGDSTLFSFNTPEGACRKCKGLGKELVVDRDKLLDWDKSLAEGAILHSEYKIGGRRWSILKVSELFDMDKKLRDFSEEEIEKLLYSKRIELSSKDESGFVQRYSFEGVVSGSKRRRMDKRGLKMASVERDSKYYSLKPCSECKSGRLNDKALSVKVRDKNIGELSEMYLKDLRNFIEEVKGPVADVIVERVKNSLDNMIDIGLGYLSLNRPVKTLSGGESQRVKMARQLGNSLVEMVYILDEPSVGLHEKEVDGLVEMLKRLRDTGNSVLVVEHDKKIIKAADYVVDVGPKAGVNGGKIVFEGKVEGLLKNNGLTGEFLRGKKKELKSKLRKISERVSIENANLHNLRGLSVDVPKNVFACVTGVSGSGKSTLINDIFAKQVNECVVVDQSQVGKSSRSNPATYINVFGKIRREFGKANGVSVGMFSFNSKGKCAKCKGLGYQKIEMHFLDSVEVKCEECEGKRYCKEALEHEYKRKNIAEVLAMTVDEAVEFFAKEKIVKKLAILKDVGLGYLTLGQPLKTLSGGEAQRIKIVRELSKKGKIYVFDEPTTGLHMADVEKLVEVLNKLVDNGNSVIVIEHNMDVISQADWIIDMGPEGGEKGGQVIAEGRPMDIAKVEGSYTGNYLKGCI